MSMATETSPEKIAELMVSFRQGDKRSADRLMELLYPELRRLAAAQMGSERADHSWQPTSLVNEFYLQLVKIKALPPDGTNQAQQKAAFMGLAAFMMRRLLIQHARPLARRVEKVELREELDLAAEGIKAMGEVEKALSQLAAIDPKLRTVVEMKVFEGLSNEEVATRLDCSLRTVARYWSFARHWLQQELS